MNFLIHTSMTLFIIFKALNYLRMSSRIDAVSQRVQTAVTMKQVMKDRNTSLSFKIVDQFCSYSVNFASFSRKRLVCV